MTVGTETVVGIGVHDVLENGGEFGWLDLLGGAHYGRIMLLSSYLSSYISLV